MLENFSLFNNSYIGKLGGEMWEKEGGTVTDCTYR